MSKPIKFNQRHTVTISKDEVAIIQELISKGINISFHFRKLLHELSEQHKEK